MVMRKRIFLFFITWYTYIFTKCWPFLLEDALLEQLRQRLLLVQLDREKCAFSCVYCSIYNCQVFFVASAYHIRTSVNLINVG